MSETLRQSGSAPQEDFLAAWNGLEGVQQSHIEYSMSPVEGTDTQASGHDQNFPQDMLDREQEEIDRHRRLADSRQAVDRAHSLPAQPPQESANSEGTSGKGFVSSGGKQAVPAANPSTGAGDGLRKPSPATVAEQHKRKQQKETAGQDSPTSWRIQRQTSGGDSLPSSMDQTGGGIFRTPGSSWSLDTTQDLGRIGPDATTTDFPALGMDYFEEPIPVNPVPANKRASIGRLLSRGGELLLGGESFNMDIIRNMRKDRVPVKPVMIAESLLRGRVGNVGESTQLWSSSKPLNSEQKLEKENQDKKNKDEVIYELQGEVISFTEQVRSLEQRGQVKVFRLVRADGLKTGATHKKTGFEFLRQVLYDGTHRDFVARLGTKNDSMGATISEFTTGQKNQSDTQLYNIVEETTGWVVETRPPGPTMDITRLKALQRSSDPINDPKRIKSREEKWLAEILMYGMPSDREAYGVLGALGDGTFSNVRITGEGDSRRAEIVSRQSDKWIVGADGRSWDRVYPINGSNGMGYVVVSSNQKYKKEETFTEQAYPDNILTRSLVKLGESAAFEPNEFIRRVDEVKNSSNGVTYGHRDPRFAMSVLYRWLEAKRHYSNP